jgi:hypothetical protein
MVYISSLPSKIVDKNKGRQIKIGIVDKAINIYKIIFEHNYRVRIPHRRFF